MDSIRFELEGELVAEPRPGQMTIEGAAAHELAHGREAAQTPRPARNLGRDAGGEPYTFLRVRVSPEQWVDVAVRGRLVERVGLLDRGIHVRVTGQVAGTSAGGPGGFLSLHADRVTALPASKAA